jgi:hypothetical protein
LKTHSNYLCGAVGWLFVLLACPPTASPQSVIEPQSVSGLQFRTKSSTVVLTWPSTRNESFAVFWRSNVTVAAQWVALTNQIPASKGGSKTSYRDAGALTRSSAMGTNADLGGFYRVFAIPDFYFDMEGVTLTGGPKNPDKDFLPIRYDTNWAAIREPQIGLLVDGSDEGFGIWGTERVNFGTLRKPVWKNTPGFWFLHDSFSNGTHTLQLVASLSMNNFIGELSQFVNLSNRPVHINVSSGGRVENSWWDKRLGRQFMKLPLPYPDVPPLPQSNQDDKVSPASVTAALAETNTANPSMKLDLGATSRFIRVTSDYSNAVRTAVLPFFSDVAKKLELPVPQPIMQNDIAGFRVLPFRDLTTSMLLKNGWVFNFGFGYVQDFSSSNSYFNLQDPDQIPKYFGKVNMNQAEAAELARTALRRLNIPLEDVFADLEPDVKPLVKIGTNTVPRYDVIWIDPYGTKSAEFEVNAEAKQIERMHLHSRNLHRPSPALDKPPVLMPSEWPVVTSEYARQLIPLIFQAIGAYVEKLSLPVVLPLTTNNVALVEIHDNGGWPHAEITLTNGWRFIYRHTMVNGYYSPNALVTAVGRPIHVKELEGKWNLTTNQAIKLIKETLTKLDYPTNNIHMDFAPNVVFPAGNFRSTIPRYFFEWHYENATHDDLQSKVEAEVNADSGKLESLYYDDKAYWDSRPPIDVPISNNN